MLTLFLSALLGAATTSAAPTVSPPLQSGLLLLRPLDAPAPSLPACATHAATVGAQTRSAVYYIDPLCRKRAGDDGVLEGVWEGDDGATAREWTWEGVQLSAGAAVAREESGEETLLSTLFWAHSNPIPEDHPHYGLFPSPFSSFSSALGDDNSAGSAAQLPFLAPSASTGEENPLLASRPDLEPTPLLRLPGGEGALFALSGNPLKAKEQLEYMTSHPSYSHMSWVSVPFLSRPVSSAAPALEGRFPEVDKHAVERVQKHLDGLRFSPAISRVVGTLEEKLAKQRLQDDVEVLSGEDQTALKDEEKWVSRHSMSTGAPKAARWLIEKMSSYSFTCTPHTFAPGFSPMLECVYDNSELGERVTLETGYQRDYRRDIEFKANETVVLGAHYDSRGSFGYPTAPGADDDASGTSLVLAVARAVSGSSLRFSRRIVFALFAGEEQGLLGSAWYARYLAEGRGGKGEREDVAAMLQVDMVGFRKPGEPMQLARPDVIGLKEAGWLVGNISEVYVPELVTGYTAACCSDHQTFVENAYPATWIFERNGPIADPCYHSSCDLSARPGYDFEQITAHAKVALAFVAEMGGMGYV
ncbi:hypothetical protein JCM10213_000135 [Rhodosporidiobolus nylandii]